MASPLAGVDVPTFLAVFCRTTAWASTCSYVGDKSIPRRVRMAACVLFSVALTGARPSISWDGLWAVIPSEVVIGLLAGAAVRLVISGAEAAGQLIGLQLELGFASNFDPLMQDDSLPTRRIAYVMAGLAFLGAGGLERSLQLLAAPGLHAPSGHALLTQAVYLVGQTASLAIGLAGPVLCAALVSNLAMGLASRAAPALNVFSVVLACVLVLGGIVLLGTAPMLAHGLYGVARFATEAPMSFFVR